MSYRDDWFANNESDHGWYTCAKCGKKIRKADADIDHIVPQKYGGSDKLFNLQCLCKHCNRSKQASMKETVPDLLKTNHQRAVKAVKKNAQFVKSKVVEGVKTVVKNATTKVLGDSDKKTTAAKKASTIKKATATKNETATKKASTATKSETATKKSNTANKSETATKKTSTATKSETATKKASTATKAETATKKSSTTKKDSTAKKATATKKK